VVPYSSFLTPNEVANAFGILPLWRAVQRGFVAPSHLSEVVILLALVGGLVFLLLPRRLALLAPALVLLYLAAANSPVVGTTRLAAIGSRYGGISGSRDWIDRAVGTKPRVTALWSGAPGVNFVSLWDNEFFNRSVGPVYNLHGPPDGLPQETIAFDRHSVARHANGTAVRARYVLTDRSLLIAGRPIATDQGVGMVLYRVDGPIRAVGRIEGLYPDAWSGRSVSYTGFSCRGGSLVVTLTSDPVIHPHSQVVTATSGSRQVARITILRKHDVGRHLIVPLRPQGGICTVGFTVTPTAVPEQTIGTGDARKLGIRFVRVQYRPPR
jgi:hypothetical protein